MLVPGRVSIVQVQFQTMDNEEVELLNQNFFEKLTLNHSIKPDVAWSLISVNEMVKSTPLRARNQWGSSAGPDATNAVSSSTQSLVAPKWLGISTFKPTVQKLFATCGFGIVPATSLVMIGGSAATWPGGSWLTMAEGPKDNNQTEQMATWWTGDLWTMIF